jgi:gamma-glutamyltranspeptidase/glutathione hydrolase
VAAGLNRVLARNPDNRELGRFFGKRSSEPWCAGDRLVQPDLAHSLESIATQGAAAFYEGPIADRLVAEMNRAGGLITGTDLADYRAKLREPIHGTYHGYDVYAPPPPSSGGICLVEMLNVLENFHLRRLGRWSADTLHLMTEAMRRAYCDRARYLGDPDFVPIPARLTDKDYARRLADTIDCLRATRSEALAHDVGLQPEGSETTHFSVIDTTGMAVSNTYTLENAFGSKIVVPGAGFLLNDEMGDFNPLPGVTNRHGLIGTPANLVAPGKRMLSSMCPIIVARNGRVVLVSGCPGGRTIINTMLCVLLNVLEFRMPLREAIDAPRMHHAWFPDRLVAEEALLADCAEALQELAARGQAIDPHPAAQGDAHSIQVDPRTGKRLGVADRRRSGWAAGY